MQVKFLTKGILEMPTKLNSSNSHLFTCQFPANSFNGSLINSIFLINRSYVFFNTMSMEQLFERLSEHFLNFQRHFSQITAFWCTKSIKIWKIEKKKISKEWKRLLKCGTVSQFPWLIGSCPLSLSTSWDVYHTLVWR